MTPLRAPLPIASCALCGAVVYDQVGWHAHLRRCERARPLGVAPDAPPPTTRPPRPKVTP